MLALLVDHSELLPFLFAAVSVLFLLPAYLIEFLRKPRPVQRGRRSRR